MFGLHLNAEITYFSNSAKQAWEDLLLMQVSSGGSGSKGNRDDNIENTANDILGKLPETLWDVNILRAQHGAEPSPTTIVLFQ